MSGACVGESDAQGGSRECTPLRATHAEADARSQAFVNSIFPPGSRYTINMRPPETVGT